MVPPAVTYVQPYQGDEWQPFRFSDLVGREEGRVYALKFADGSTWDTFCGWRVVSTSSAWDPSDEEEEEEEEEEEDAEVKTMDVMTLERFLTMLRQVIGRSGGATVLNMHDKDGQMHFSIEGMLPHNQERI